MTTFKEFERDAWEAKAGRYQTTWGPVTAQSIPAVLALARVGPGTKLLDIGAGPGALCFEAAALGAVPTGCDYSAEMVRIASERYPTVPFFQEDAEALSFGDSSFDAVTMNYLLLHLADPERALQEAVRVLRIGGRLVYSHWCKPADSAGLGLIFDAIKAYGDTSVIPPAGEIFRFSDPEVARQVLSASGLRDIHHEVFEGFWKVDTADEFFVAVQAGTRMGGLVDLQTRPVKELIRRQIAERIEVYRDGVGFKVPMPSLLASGSK